MTSLVPLGRLAVSWGEYFRVLGRPLEATPPRGFDGVRWTDDDAIVAAYVLPGSPGYRAGIREGDRLASLDYGQVFTAADLQSSIERATGTVQTYGLLRNGQPMEVDVAIARDPTFLYPLSERLWVGGAWGFALATLVHVLALSTIWPLARRAPRARRAAWLIGTALTWVGGNLLRIVWVSLDTPGPGAPVARTVFDILTLLAVAGWLAFPYLLLRDDVLRRPHPHQSAGWVRAVLAVPPLGLALGVAIATVRGHVGPLPPDAFVAPIVFYVCIYVGAATLLAVALRRDPEQRGMHWLRVGYAFVAVLALAGAVFAYGVGASPTVREDVGAGWFLTSLQLFSVLPVVLVSLDTLRFGQFDVVLARGLTYAVSLAALFLVVVGGQSILSAVVPGGAGPVALGALVVGVLVTIQQVSPIVARWREGWQRDGRAAALGRLDRFGERVRTTVDLDTLAALAATTIGEAFEPRSAAVFLRRPETTGEDPWVRAPYRPEPPTFDAQELQRVWDALRRSGRVWARNEELDEAELPARDADRLRTFGVALAVPVSDGEGEPLGLFVLGRKLRRFQVYTTADVERLRGLAGQLALATERLRLLEREKTLVRQTTEAELVALRAQINPHFLFNALNTVAALIAERPEEAEATVESLAGLFRDVLSASGRPFVSLTDELRLVRRYLDVEQARFGDSLHVEIDVDPALAGVEVPAFAVQTLVENAVKHGIERKRGGGTVRVRVHEETAGLTLVEVSDTGVGIPALFAETLPSVESPPPSDAAAAPALPPYFGDGLTNVAQRLRQLYGPPDCLVVSSTPDGTTATLTLPARPCPSTS